MDTSSGLPAEEALCARAQQRSAIDSLPDDAGTIHVQCLVSNFQCGGDSPQLIPDRIRRKLRVRFFEVFLKGDEILLLAFLSFISESIGGLLVSVI